MKMISDSMKMSEMCLAQSRFGFENPIPSTVNFLAQPSQIRGAASKPSLPILLCACHEALRLCPSRLWPSTRVS